MNGTRANPTIAILGALFACSDQALTGSTARSDSSCLFLRNGSWS